MKKAIIFLIIGICLLIYMLIFHFPPTTGRKIVWENEEIQKENAENLRNYTLCLAAWARWKKVHPDKDEPDCCSWWEDYNDNNKSYWDQWIRYGGIMSKISGECSDPCCKKYKPKDKVYFDNGKRERGFTEGGYVAWREVK